jgi:hypothetical protein
MATITLPPNSRAIGNTAHTSDHNQIVDAITAVNAESTSLTKGVSPVNEQTGATYTLVLSDAGKTIECNYATAFTLTVPPGGTVAFDTRTRIDLIQTGAGQVTVQGGSGVTVNARGGLKLAGQWASASLIKRGTDSWVLVGTITA